jgi:hypothetical protein
VLLSTNNGTQWSKIYNDPSSEIVFALAACNNDIFAGINMNGIVHSNDNGTTWNEANHGLTNNNISAFVCRNDNIFAAAYTGVFISTDDGSTWASCNNGLSGINYLIVYNNILYTASGGGVISSTDNGTSWTAVNNKFAGSSILTIAHSGNSLFAGTWGDGIFRTGDTDTVWMAADSGLTNKYIHSLVAIDSNIFAGTERGVFLSTNNGRYWHCIDSGLTNKYVQTLLISNNNLFAGTIGCGVWYRPLTEMITTGVKDKENDLPNQFSLSQNYPNPFNPSTTITFSVGMYSYTSLQVYDVLGREVATIVSEKLPAGNYSRQWNAANMPSGIYFYRLKAGDFIETRKLVLLK